MDPGPNQGRRLTMRYAGIDVQKGQSHFYIQDDLGKKIEGGLADTDPQAFSDLVSRHRGDEGISVVMETGNLSFILARAMKEAGAEVFIVDPYQNALIARSRKKTDRLDARQLSEQGRLGILPPHSVYVPSDKAEDLRRLVSARARLVKERTALSNRAIRVADRNQHPVKRSSLSWGAAWRLLEAASANWSEVDRLLIRQYARDAARLREQIKELEEMIERLLERDFGRECRLLMTIPGIGPITAAALIAQVEDVKRFGSARQLCGYLGLAPSVRRSGKMVMDGRITKKGNGRLRGYLTQAALHCLRSMGPRDPLRLWYESVRKRRGWKKARVALARKLASIAYGVLVHGRAYDPAYALPPSMKAA